jgi:phosphatidylglycerophosphatase A
MAADAQLAGRDLRDPAILIATWFGIGLVKWAPGTFASLAALPLAWILRSYTGPLGLAMAAGALFVVGTWAAARYERRTGTHDSSAIVVDEVVGQWITLLLIPAELTVYALAFVLFRLFDILKPWPISLADRRIGGGFGVMFDDVLAGIVAAVFLWHVWVWL